MLLQLQILFIFVDFALAVICHLTKQLFGGWKREGQYAPLHQSNNKAVRRFTMIDQSVNSLQNTVWNKDANVFCSRETLLFLGAHTQATKRGENNKYIMCFTSLISKSLPTCLFPTNYSPTVKKPFHPLLQPLLHPHQSLLIPHNTHTICPHLTLLASKKHLTLLLASKQPELFHGLCPSI